MSTRHVPSALLWIAFAIVAPSVAAQGLVRGPYLQVLTPTSVVVRWRTDVATDSRVAFGASPGNLDNVVTNAVSTAEHVVALGSLSPDTTYFYAIGTTSVVLAGADSEHFFVTSPNPGSQKPVRIWVIGDSGTANSNAAAVRDAYIAFNNNSYTQAWLMLGDNAYSDGTDAEYQDAVFDMYPTLLRQTALWPTLGNHDGHSASSGSQSGPYYDIFTLPKNGEAGGLASGTEAYYSFDYANIHFICLDSYDSDTSPGGPMMTWLENDLATNTQQWIVAYWHHPPYSKGSHDSDSEGSLREMRENALPILESYGVDLVLSGHSHSYERSFFINGHYGHSSTLTSGMIVDGGDGRENGDGVYARQGTDGAVYVVAGSSGKASGGSLDHPVMFVSLSQLGSMVLDFDGGQLDATFINETGAVEDYWTISKGPPANQAPLVDAGPDRSVTLPDSANLDGTASDDGLPNPPATLTTTWSFVSGPGTASFADPSAVDTTATFSIDGTYVLRLSADDTELSAADVVTIHVLPEAPTNQPPSVDAGPDQTVQLAVGASLNGTVSDDGLPNPPQTVWTSWDKVSGPGTVTFTDASAVDTLASFSTDGVYVLRLTAGDGALAASDEVSITALTDTHTLLEFSRSNDDFSNPERGLLRNPRFYPNGGSLPTNQLPAETLMWVYYMLDDYRDQAIDSTALARISETFDDARNRGVKLIPVFAYNFGPIGAPDAPLDRVLEHISQLKPILQQQSDVIATFMAGFVGAWGEWHSSTNNLTEPENQKAILDALLDALPPQTTIQLRYPRDKKTHYGGPLSAADAFSGSDASRIGHTNHCFLSDDNDAGTYRSTPFENPSEATIEEWKSFIAEEGRFTPVGGETCSANPPRSLCPTALTELERLHWSWLNRTYHPDVLDSWVAGGCMDTIKRRLGYRIVLRNALVPQSVQPGGTLEFQVSLTNEGYAAMYNARPLYIVLEKGTARHIHRLDAVDPRRWESGQDYTLTASMALPPGMEAGAYKLGLWLPDPTTTLQNRPEYAVRFANTNVWDAATGVNILTSDLRVDSAGNDAPIVNAGIDQTIPLAAVASLDGTVVDDGLPAPPNLTVSWSQVSGPGAVTFANAAVEDTTASFSTDGVYVLRLTADDGLATTSDDVTITVEPSAVQVLDVVVDRGSDDAEQKSNTDVMNLTSSHLNISKNVVGVRFNGVDVPRGATISAAYVEFTARRSLSSSTTLTIFGEASDSASTFTNANSDISTRPTTNASVPWSPEAWTANASHRTSDLSAIVQEIIHRPGWASGNSLVLSFTTGSGGREARTYDANVTPAPKLHVEFSDGGPPHGPCLDPLDLYGQNIVADQVHVACTIMTAEEVQVFSPADVTFLAGSSIALRNGFTVFSGANFTAMLDPTLVP